MKKTILLFLLMTSTILFSQSSTKFEISKNGFTDFIVTEIPNKTSTEIYIKTLEWINKTFKNPEKVILGKVENYYIRIEGSSNSLYVLNSLGLENPLESKYQIEISVKDGKYKFDVTEIKYLAPQIGWTDVPITFFYKKDGELKVMFKYTQKIPEYFNSLNKSLSDYISGTGIEAKNNDW